MAAPRAKLRTLLVSAGSITPSSHSLADANSGRPSSSYLHAFDTALDCAAHKPIVKQWLSIWEQLLQCKLCVAVQQSPYLHIHTYSGGLAASGSMRICSRQTGWVTDRAATFCSNSARSLPSQRCPSLLLFCSSTCKSPRSARTAQRR